MIIGNARKDVLVDYGIFLSHIIVCSLGSVAKGKTISGKGKKNIKQYKAIPFPRMGIGSYKLSLLNF